MTVPSASAAPSADDYLLHKTLQNFFPLLYYNYYYIFFPFLYGIILGILGVFLRITRVFLGIIENRVHFNKALRFFF